MTAEQLFPTRWVLNGIPSRDEYATHLRRLRHVSRKLAVDCSRHTAWLGVYPLKSNWTIENSNNRQRAWLARYMRRESAS